MALASLKAVKTYLGIEPGVTTADELLERLLDAASNWLESQTRREFAEKEYTEWFDGDGSAAITPANYPITSITSLTIDGVATALWTEQTGVGAAIVSGRIELFDPNGLLVFTKGRRNVKLVYKANFNPVPPDVVQAVIELVAWRYREKDRPGQNSQSGGNTTVSFSQAAAPRSVLDVIEAYANVQRLG